MKTRILFLALLVVTGCPTMLQCQPARQVSQPVGTPSLTSNPAEIQLNQPVFTFVRIQYSSAGGRRSAWATDFPDADRNFTAQLRKVTGWNVNTEGVVLGLTDPILKQHPFLYVAEAGQMHLTPEEIRSLREYLLGGGFLMMDDFWGEKEWDSVRAEMKRVFPERDTMDLPLTHPIFHCFYDMKEKPQVPNVALGTDSLNPSSPYYGVTWERPDAREAHYRALFDDQGRMMAVFCHNTDLGDGWEREGVNESYHREFSVKKAYPMGINIVVHALSNARNAK